MGSLSKMQSWSQNRLPEYLCLGLILNKYGRKKGLEKSYFILNKLHEINKELSVPTFSLILNLDIEEQNKIETLHEISFAYDI